jgi:hypothetical protein
MRSGTVSTRLLDNNYNITRRITQVKKFILVAGLVSSAAVAQDFGYVQTPVLCGPFSRFLEVVGDKDIAEQPWWRGQNLEANSSYLIFKNPKTDAWTLVIVHKSTACLLGVGTVSETYTTPKTENVH